MELKLNESKTLIYIGETEENKEAYVSFTENNGILTIRHIFVDPKFRGQGISGKLLVELTDYVRKNNFKITSMCGYSTSWLLNHEEYKDLLV